VNAVLKVQRRERILADLRKRGAARVTELALRHWTAQGTPGSLWW
jgi:hypothetical protein